MFIHLYRFYGSFRATMEELGLGQRPYGCKDQTMYVLALDRKFLLIPDFCNIRRVAMPSF